MMTKDELLRLADFLEQTAETNEDTEFDSSQDYLVEGLIRLVREKGKTSIVEDFETPYVHPMITVQKWVEELKLLVSQSIREETAS